MWTKFDNHVPWALESSCPVCRWLEHCYRWFWTPWHTEKATKTSPTSYPIKTWLVGKLEMIVTLFRAKWVNSSLPWQRNGLVAMSTSPQTLIVRFKESPYSPWGSEIASRSRAGSRPFPTTCQHRILFENSNQSPPRQILCMFKYLCIFVLSSKKKV